MLPTFLSPLLAERALVIGKSINFIRLCIQKCPKSSEVKIKIKKQVKNLILHFKNLFFLFFLFLYCFSSSHFSSNLFLFLFFTFLIINT